MTPLKDLGNTYGREPKWLIDCILVIYILVIVQGLNIEFIPMLSEELGQDRIADSNVTAPVRCEPMKINAVVLFGRPPK